MLKMFENISGISCIRRSKLQNFLVCFALFVVGFFFPLRIVLHHDVMYLLNRSLVLWISHCIAEELYCKHTVMQKGYFHFVSQMV